MTLPTLYKLSDAVKALGPGAPCERTLREEVKAGRLIAKRIGRCLRVSDVELTRWALDTGTPSKPAAPTAPAADVPGPSSGPAAAPGPGQPSHPSVQTRQPSGPESPAAVIDAMSRPDTGRTDESPVPVEEAEVGKDLAHVGEVLGGDSLERRSA